MLLRNYPTPRDSHISCLVSEALLACLASPTYFDPVRIGGVTAFDGGIACTNPSILALQEAKDLWNVDPDDFSAFVSIGTGFRQADSLDGGMNAFKLVKLLTQLATETTSSHERMTSIFKDAMNQAGYYRFEVQQGVADIAVDEIAQVEKIGAAARLYVLATQTQQSLSACAQALSNTYIAEFLFAKGSKLGAELSSGQLEQSLRVRKNKVELQLRRNAADRDLLRAELARIEAILDDIKRDESEGA